MIRICSTIKYVFSLAISHSEYLKQKQKLFKINVIGESSSYFLQFYHRTVFGENRFCEKHTHGTHTFSSSVVQWSSGLAAEEK